MKLIHGVPPNYEDVCKVFPTVATNPRVIFTYGHNIYSPSGLRNLTEDLIAHEEVHERQQCRFPFMTPKRWWKKYLNDPDFRLKQEIEAYRVQTQEFSKRNNNRREKSQFVHRIAKDLSSDVYGNIISHQEAVRMIVE